MSRARLCRETGLLPDVIADLIGAYAELTIDDRVMLLVCGGPEQHIIRSRGHVLLNAGTLSLTYEKYSRSPGMGHIIWVRRLGGVKDITMSALIKSIKDQKWQWKGSAPMKEIEMQALDKWLCWVE